MDYSSGKMQLSDGQVYKAHGSIVSAILPLGRYKQSCKILYISYSTIPGVCLPNLGLSTVKDHDLVENINVQRFASRVSLKMWDSEYTKMLNSQNLPSLEPGGKS